MYLRNNYIYGIIRSYLIKIKKMLKINKIAKNRFTVILLSFIVFVIVFGAGQYVYNTYFRQSYAASACDTPYGNGTYGSGTYSGNQNCSFGDFVGPLSGTVGDSFPGFLLTGCSLPNGTSATLGSGSNLINGVITNCIFVPNSGSVITASMVGINSLVLNVTGLTSINISTLFTNNIVITSSSSSSISSSSSNTSSSSVNLSYTFGTYNGILTGAVGSAFPSFTLIGCNLPDTTNPVTIGISGTTINGTVTKTTCIFTPFSGTLIVTTLTNGFVLSLSAPNIPTSTIASYFTNPIISSSFPTTGGGSIIITNKSASSVSAINSSNVTITKPSITDPLDCLQRITGNATGDSIKISLEFYDLKSGKLSYLFQDLPKSNSGDYLFQLNTTDINNPNYVAAGDYKIKYIATDKNNQTVSGEYEANIKVNTECKKNSLQNGTLTLPKTGGNATTETPQQTSAEFNQVNVPNSGSTPRTGGLANIIITLGLFVIPVSAITFLVFRRKDIPSFKNKK